MDKVMIDLPVPYVDERGKIQVLTDFPVGSVVLIESTNGSIRANHYHKKDNHYCYLISGCIEYYHRPVGSDEEPEKIIIQPGQLFYSPPMVEHAMKFTEDSVFLALTKRNREQKNYENDLVRVKLI